MKIGPNLPRLKHQGLARTSRKSKPKPKKIPNPQPNNDPQLNLLIKPPNPPNKRMTSESKIFEKLKIFQLPKQENQLPMPNPKQDKIKSRENKNLGQEHHPQDNPEQRVNNLSQVYLTHQHKNNSSARKISKKFRQYLD